MAPKRVQQRQDFGLREQPSERRVSQTTPLTESQINNVSLAKFFHPKSNRLKSMSSALRFNNTDEENDSGNAVNDFRAFEISMLSLSACVLTVTAITCCVSHVKQWRPRKRACEYDSACDLDEEPVKLKDVQKSQSLRKSLPLESFRKDESDIYYIHTTPLPVQCNEKNDYDDQNDDDVRPTHTTPTPADPRDCIILDPPTFYILL